MGGKSIREAKSAETVAAYSAGAVTAGLPYLLHPDKDGVLQAINGAVDSNTLPGRFGIALETTTGAGYSRFQTAGIVNCGTGLSENLVVTAIAANGTVTETTADGTTADVCVATVVSATSILII